MFALQARRRALGNIQFIGNLYQHRMLTEKIMHGCITELLTEVLPSHHAYLSRKYELSTRALRFSEYEVTHTVSRNLDVIYAVLDACCSLQTESPKAEEIECLCKLMSTIGHLLDATSKKGPERMDAYFSRMHKVKEAKSLESRHRFLIQVRGCSSSHSAS